jgi:hypothetical protein
VQRMVLGMLSDWLSNLSESHKRVFLFPGIGTSHQTGPRTVICDILSTYEDRFAIQAQVSIPGVWGWALKKQIAKIGRLGQCSRKVATNNW